ITLRSTSGMAWKTPPAAANPSRISLVRLPVGQGPFRKSTNLRCGTSWSRPAMVQAAFTWLITATALGRAIARTPQCASFSGASRRPYLCAGEVLKLDDLVVIQAPPEVDLDPTQQFAGSQLGRLGEHGLRDRPRLVRGDEPLLGVRRAEPPGDDRSSDLDAVQ